AHGLPVRARFHAHAGYAADAAAAGSGAGMSAASAIVHVALRVDLTTIPALLIAVGKAGVAGALAAVTRSDETVVVCIRGVGAMGPVGMLPTARDRGSAGGTAARVLRGGLDAAGDTPVATPNPDTWLLVQKRIGSAC